jgi:peptidoglycan hydrolase-like protein with peptidoglycan-binding domain
VWRLRADQQLTPTGSTALVAGSGAPASSVALPRAVVGSAPALPAPPLARGAQGAAVEQLQQALVDGGYLSASDLATGPGTYGPRTQAAVAAAQRAQGLTPTGRYDEATRAALSTPTAPAVPGAVTAPGVDLARGATGSDVEQLQQGLVSLGYLGPADAATGPGQYGPRTEQAVRRFQAQHGLPPSGRYDAATRDWMTRRLAGEAPPPPPPPGELPSSAAEANAHFVTQFTSAYNPTGPSSSTNCGPASVAMALDAAGRMPSGLTPEQRVDYARALMYPGTTPTSYVDVGGQQIPQLNDDHALSSTGAVASAFSGAGGTSYSGSGWEALDAALAAGDPVVAHGYYGKSGWGATLESAGAAQGYESGYAGGGNIGHFNAILGKTADGRYVVADPMYTGGTVELTREQLEQYFSPSGGSPAFTALG